MANDRPATDAGIGIGRERQQVGANRRIGQRALMLETKNPCRLPLRQESPAQAGAPATGGGAAGALDAHGPCQHQREAADGPQEHAIPPCDAHPGMVPFPRVDFRYLAIEGPPGLGKTALAERLGARLDAAVVRDDAENPFLADFYAGRGGAAFQAQLFFTLARHRQLQQLRQGDLFSQTTICDYVFERDRIYAFTNLDDNELFIYQRLYDLVSRDVPVPDLVVYLQAPADMLKRLARERSKRTDGVTTTRRCRARTTSRNSARRTTTSSFTTRPRRCWSSKPRRSTWAGATKRSTTCCARSSTWARARSTTCPAPAPDVLRRR